MAISYDAIWGLLRAKSALAMTRLVSCPEILKRYFTTMSHHSQMGDAVGLEQSAHTRLEHPTQGVSFELIPTLCYNLSKAKVKKGIA